MSHLYKILIFNAIFLLSGTVHALSVGQGTNFESGTVEGWEHNMPSAYSPSVIADNGPSGLGSNALLIAASGANGPGGRLLALQNSAGNLDADVNGFKTY